jgi:hypothetical protein
MAFLFYIIPKNYEKHEGLATEWTQRLDPF